MSVENCPTPNQLKAFSVGDLAQDLIHEIAEHVVQCKKCGHQMRRFDGHRDELVQSLHAMGDSLKVSVDSTPHDQLTADDQRTTNDADSLILDLGRSYSVRLAHGQVRQYRVCDRHRRRVHNESLGSRS